jgi:hypothetical protein
LFQFQIGKFILFLQIEMNEKEEIQVASALTNLNDTKVNKILPLGNKNDSGNDDDCFRVGMAHLNLEVSY